MRLLHTMLRVGNIERSVKFYTEVLGMKLLRTTDRPEQKYSLAFVGYDTEDRASVLELTYNYGVDKYDLGAAFGHIAFEMPDVAKACDAVRAKGGKSVARGRSGQGRHHGDRLRRGSDGYKIEFIERKGG